MTTSVGYPTPLRVQCNRGFGSAFWFVIGVTLLLTLFGVAQGWATGSGKGAAVGLLIGASVGVIFLVTRAVLLPQLSIDLERGRLRTRFRTIPFYAVAVVRFEAYGRPGSWADFMDADGRVLARMALADTFFATPTAAQWHALRCTIASASAVGGYRSAQTPLRHSSWVPVDAAVQALDAQASWCAAGKRSSSRHAPVTAFYGTHVALH